MEVLPLVGAFFACLAAATVQGTIGFGFAMLAVPLCAVIDPRFVPVPQALLAATLACPMAWRERHHIQWRAVAWILVGRLPGTALGIWLLKNASARSLGLLLAGFVLAAVAAMATGVRIKRMPLTEVLGGLLSSVGSVTSSIGGPPIALLFREERGPILRANLAAVFVVGLFLTLSARGLAGEISGWDLKVAAVLWPAILIALVISKRLAPKVEGPWLRHAVLVLAAMAGVALLVRAW